MCNTSPRQQYRPCHLECLMLVHYSHPLRHVDLPAHRFLPFPVTMGFYSIYRNNVQAIYECIYVYPRCCFRAYTFYACSATAFIILLLPTSEIHKVFRLQVHCGMQRMFLILGSCLFKLMGEVRTIKRAKKVPRLSLSMFTQILWCHYIQYAGPSG